MKHFKKLAAALLALSLLSGCRKQADPKPEDSRVSVTETAAPESTETPVIEETPEVTESPEITEEPEETKTPAQTEEPMQNSVIVEEAGIYDTKDEVAWYLYTYHHLPSNFMTKKEARKRGWEGGALNRTIKGMCIGGDVFRDYEDSLPEIDGKYYECDIGTLTKRSRGAKRLIWSYDYQDIYYTDDHYDTFEHWNKGVWE